MQLKAQPRRRFSSATVIALALAAGCNRPRCQRQDPKDASTKPTTEFGNPTGTAGFKAQCSGWFPDWISKNPPAPGQRSFQLAQGYPLGLPVLVETPDHKLKIDHYDPYAPANDAVEAPWLPLDPKLAADQPAYVDALKAYLLAGNIGAADVEDDFIVQNNTERSWFHVPMMTTSPFARREPYHGLTAERMLRREDHKWIKNTAPSGLRSYAIGAYNWLGGYTIGQVFKDPNPGLADASKAAFIEGAFVFKLLFAEYDPAKIDPALDPLVGSPEWHVQDVTDPGGPLVPVRLLQVDVAVRDNDAGPTGWVFATFVYDKGLPGPSPWQKLRPVGLQWGNAIGATSESWLAPGIPAALQREDGRPFGLDGRLNGPVDNPDSSCMSCHSTAQLVTGITGNNATAVNAARGAELFAPGCTQAQTAYWFRNVPAGAPFGVMDGGGTGCNPVAPQPGTPPLHGLDYSLQLAEGLESSLVRQNANPCMPIADALKTVDIVEAPLGDAHAMAELRERMSARNLRELKRSRLQGLPDGVLRKLRAPTLVDASKAMAPPDQTPDDGHRR